MIRTAVASLVVFALFTPAAHAGERPTSDPVAPTAAVAAAWKKEAPKPSSTLRALLVSYGAAQALDMGTTIAARNRGAIEANPVLQGGYGSAIATKAALGAVTMVAVKAIDRKSRKAAILTMIAANVATTAVAVHNMRVSHQIGR